MAKVDVIKTSFAAGEFGNSLLGRTDVAQYENACAIVENMLVRPYGSAISTPGTRYINECKFSESGTDSTVRLIPFVFNQVDAFAIEMGEKYFRFYTDRGAVVVGTSSTLYEIAHIYDEDEVEDIQHTQLNDIIWMAHPDHPQQVLTRLGAASWTIGNFSFLGGPFLDDNTTTITIKPGAVSGTSATLGLSATTSTIKFVPSGSTLGHINSYWKVGGVVTTATTALQGYVKITAVTNPTTATCTIMATLSSTAATTSFAEGAWSAVRGYPARVIFHDGRLWFARTKTEPNGVWGSHLYIYDDFSLNEQSDSDGLNVKLASNESNEVQWLASGKSLIAGTYGGAFVIRGSGEDVITPTNITAKQEISLGAEPVQPKRIGNFFYYIQRFKRKIRELFYFWDTDSYKAADKTIYNPDVTGDGIVAMAYQEVPDTILWCVRSDGEIATLTREIDHEVQGWTRQITDGEYESICAIPSQSYGYDEVWVVVKRTINGSTKRYIEMFENIEVPDRQDKCFYLHSALDFDAFEHTEEVDYGLTLSATAGTVTVTAADSYFITDDVGRRIRTIDADGNTTGELKVTAYSSATVVIGSVVYGFAATTFDGGEWGVSVEELSGLDHLEAKVVDVLADGGVDRPVKTVSDGTISLAYNYFVVAAGLPYTQKLYTLPFEAGSEKGTAQGKKQRINQVMFKFNRSYLGFKTGGDEDLAEQVVYRDPSTHLGTPEKLFTGTLPNINFRDDYRWGSQVMIINDDPLPIEILSLICSLETFDK